MKIRLSQLFFVLSQPKLSVHFKILFSLMLFKEEIVILSFMYCFWRNTPTYLPTYLPTSLMISLFLTAPVPRALVQRAWNVMGPSMRNGLRFILLFGRKYYFIQKLSFLIINLFGYVFQTSRVIGLITWLYAKLQC